MSKTKLKNKRIDALCSGLSMLTTFVAVSLLVKYHNHWKLVLTGIILFMIAILLVAFLLIYHKRKKNIEKALQTDKYDLMSGEEFEHFCADVLRGNGFGGVEVTQVSGDHGVDVIASKDGKKYAIQCKRYSKSVGNKAVQEVYSGKDIYKADIAVVMTNSEFTKQAMEDAKKLGVELWDRDKIYELQMAGLVQIKEKFSEEKILKDSVEDKRDLICPKCGGTLVLRTAKKGANAGSQFYGCSNFPNCKFIKDL